MHTFSKLLGEMILTLTSEQEHAGLDGIQQEHLLLATSHRMEPKSRASTVANIKRVPLYGTLRQ